MTIQRSTERTAPLISWDNGAKQPIYLPTTNDRLWLLRAVEGEGPNHRQVAQVLVNRFLYLRAKQPSLYPALADLILAYSQPVNPRWMKGGDKWGEAWASAKTDKQRSALLALDKKRRAHRNLSTFSRVTEDAVTRAFTAGSRDIPATAVHFAAPKTGGKAMPLLTSKPGENWLYSANGAETWQGYRPLDVEINTGGTAGGALLGLALVGLMMKRSR